MSHKERCGCRPSKTESFVSTAVHENDNDQPIDQVAQKTGSTPKVEVSANQKPFRQSAQAFVDAYAKRDAKAIGQLFTNDAEFRDEVGELTVGREDIAQSDEGTMLAQLDVKSAKMDFYMLDDVEGNPPLTFTK